MWTVDLLTPKCLAAARTVAWVSMMYTANSQALCSMFSLMCLTPFAVRSEHYMHGGTAKRQKNAADAAVRRKGCCK